MSSKAQKLPERKQVRAGQACAAGADFGVLAEQLVRMVLASPAALDLLVNELESRLSFGGDNERRVELAGCATDSFTGSLDDEALVPLETAKLISGLGKTQIYALVRQGKFPAPYRPGGVSTRWNLGELRAWRRELKPVSASTVGLHQRGLPGPVDAQRIGPPIRVSAGQKPSRSTSAHS